MSLGALEVDFAVFGAWHCYAGRQTALSPIQTNTIKYKKLPGLLTTVDRTVTLKRYVVQRTETLQSSQVAEGFTLSNEEKVSL